MVAFDLAIAEIGQYLHRSHRIIRGLRQFHSNATGRAADELSCALEAYVVLHTLAEEAHRALTLLCASSFPTYPQFPITDMTQQLLTQLLHDMQEGQEHLTLVTEATVGEIVTRENDRDSISSKPTI